VIYLASASPRRQELLRQLGIVFEVMPSDLLEVPLPTETPAQYVVRVALDKARFVAHQVAMRGLALRPVLGADTEVVLDGEILGKPADASHGQAMLKRLVGRTHEVLSGIALIAGSHERTAFVRSRVTFAPLTDEMIAAYWASGEPADKAGGYAIQGRAAAFITHIEGSYSGIVGLPLYELATLLHETQEATL
jgi:septum formation protein